jgi:hypothetical protein
MTMQRFKKIKPWDDPERVARREKLMGWLAVAGGILGFFVVMALVVSCKFGLLGL